MAEKMPRAEARMFAKTLHGFMVEKPETFAMIDQPSLSGPIGMLV